MAPMKETFPGKNAIFIYECINNDLKIKASHEIKGETLNSNTEITEQIKDDIRMFKNYIRNASYNTVDLLEYKNLPFIGIPQKGVCIRTPILQEREWFSIKSMEHLIEIYEKIITRKLCSKNFNVPEKLIKTKLGMDILNDLKNTTFTQKVFCHCYLNYKSVVLKDDKLIGITNWQYAGYYPPEFEDIIEKYMEHFI